MQKLDRRAGVVIVVAKPVCRQARLRQSRLDGEAWPVGNRYL
jgi:hypothetical protein